MKIFIIADTHFYHYNIIKYCNRPFSDVEIMNQKMIDEWNSVVSDNDIVFHLGDFGFGSREQLQNINSQLNGRKVLLKGNHDMRKGNQFWLDCGFDYVFKDKSKDLLELLNLFDITLNLELKYTSVILSHYPIQVNETELNIHGHIHNSPLDTTMFSKDNHICISTELLNYKPIEIKELI